ncbi:hypothetical protein VTN49DRAFT_3265 [Thermomyces lanuginosus]|uniref:uncharacterized protein n=1 Tax=Thermomyces lanuginosus TaxID=5541 RepID=UPI0037428D66
MPPRRVLMPVVPKEEEDPNTPPEREEGGLARTSSTVQARRPSVNGLVGGANWAHQKDDGGRFPLSARSSLPISPACVVLLLLLLRLFSGTVKSLDYACPSVLPFLSLPTLKQSLFPYEGYYGR